MPHQTRAIHYSCERLKDADGQNGPGRITSIAIYPLDTKKIASFSLGAELDQAGISYDQAGLDLDQYERSMLHRFNDYLHGKVGDKWIVWNMRDLTFGFPAIARRYHMLGGVLAPVPDNQIVDLSDVLWAMYGDNYVIRPRLLNLCHLNGMDSPNLLEGKDEALAFEQRRFNDMHNSTILKTRYIGWLAEKANDGSIKTDKPWYQHPTLCPAAIVSCVTQHWLYGLIGIFVTVVTLAQIF